MWAYFAPVKITCKPVDQVCRTGRSRHRTIERLEQNQLSETSSHKGIEEEIFKVPCLSNQVPIHNINKFESFIINMKKIKLSNILY